jgi:hypothetical protein
MTLWLALLACDPLTDLGPRAPTGRGAAPPHISLGTPDESNRAGDGVVQWLGPGVMLDWTDLQLRVSGGAGGASPSDYRMVEELGRRVVAATMSDAVEQIPVTADIDLGDVIGAEAYAAAIRARVSRWEVVEATYGTSGRVDLVAQLDVQQLLLPWLIERTRRGSSPPRTTGEVGVVVDARGTGFRPVYVLSLVSPSGEVLYSGDLWEEPSVDTPPFTYVRSMERATEGVEASPVERERDPNQLSPSPVLQLKAAATVAGALTLDDASANRARASVDLLGRTTTYVIIDGD